MIEEKRKIAYGSYYQNKHIPNLVLKPCMLLVILGVKSPHQFHLLPPGISFAW